MRADYDVVIMGGGLVGASLAACLARDASTHVAVVEMHTVPDSADTFHPSYDARNTALANGTCHVFDQLGIWQAMKQQAQPITQIEITDQGQFGKASIRAEEERVRALGYVIENRFIGHHLFQLLQRLPNVEYLAPASVEGVAYLERDILVHIRSGSDVQTQRTPLLIIADGAQSQGRRMLGIGADVYDYDQTAIVTAVTPKTPHDNVALERFTPEGPLAVLPQTDNRLGITWCVSKDRVDALLSADEATFLRALEQNAGLDEGALCQVGTRSSYPLTLTLAKEQIRPNVVVLGNAAHGLHPVAGQGFNMAMRDVVVLTQQLFQARSHGQHWGDFALLSAYLEQRQQDQFNTTQFSDKLSRFFGDRRAWVSFLRNSGLILFDTLRGTKRFVARYAMGRAVSMTLPGDSPP